MGYNPAMRRRGGPPIGKGRPYGYRPGKFPAKGKHPVLVLWTVWTSKKNNVEQTHGPMSLHGTNLHNVQRADRTYQLMAGLAC